MSLMKKYREAKEAIAAARSLEKDLRPTEEDLDEINARAVARVQEIGRWSQTADVTALEAELNKLYWDTLKGIHTLAAYREALDHWVRLGTKH